MRVFCVPILVLATILGTWAAQIPKSVTVAEGEGFMIRLDLSKEGVTGPLKSCQFYAANQVFTVNPSQNLPTKLPTGEEVFPFEFRDFEECGIRVFRANNKTQRTWKLSAIDQDGKEHSAVTEVIMTMKDLSNTCVESSYDYKCNKQRGLLLHSDCEGLECTYWFRAKMGKTVVKRVSAESEARESKELLKPLKTKSGSHVLSCQYESPDRTVVECYAEHVYSGERYLVQEGLLDGRFSAYKSDFSSGLCQIEIPANLQEKEQFGMWRMELMAKDTDFRRYEKICHFFLSDSSQQALEKLEKQTQETIVIKTTNYEVDIVCAKNLPYPLTMCYLMKNDKLIISGEWNGKCTFMVTSGNWTCGFNGPTPQDEDYSQSFQVIRYDSEVIDGAWSEDSAGRITFKCHFIKPEPIDLCLFMSPSGDVFRPLSDKFKSSTFEFYAGGRMAHGDCGITFARDVHVEVGQWKCVIGRELWTTLSTHIDYDGVKKSDGNMIE